MLYFFKNGMVEKRLHYKAKFERIKKIQSEIEALNRSLIYCFFMLCFFKNGMTEIFKSINLNMKISKFK